jgi:hypothetical protein
MANTEGATLPTRRNPDVQGTRRKIASMLRGVVRFVVGVEALFVEDQDAGAK